MARIERIEMRLVDIPPKVRRTDAIQSFVSQETPIVTVTDSDGAVGTGYSYTIGTGGSSVMRLLADHLAPRLIGREAERVEAIWRELEFATHATTVGPISALALAAIDTALWDLRCKRRGLPLWIAAGGAADRRPLYTTEGGWLHIDATALVDDALAAREQGFMGSKIKIGRPHVAEDYQRLAAVRSALGPVYEIMTDANQGFALDEAIRRAGRFADLDLAWIEEPLPADDLDGHIRLAAATTTPIAVGESMYSIRHFREYMTKRRLLDRAGRCRPHRRDHAVAQGRARGRSLRHAGLPAFPDGAARQPRLRCAERQICGIYSATRRVDDVAAPHRERHGGRSSCARNSASNGISRL